MDLFEEVAEKITIYKIRSAWLGISKLYNELANEYDATISMAFVLLAIDEKDGTPVTKIAPRMGMEPNSLSRTIKTLEKRGAVIRTKNTADKRMVYVSLTPFGIKMRELALKAVFQLEKSITKKISQKKLNTFFEVINHVPQAIEDFREDIEKYRNSL